MRYFGVDRYIKIIKTRIVLEYCSEYRKKGRFIIDCPFFKISIYDAYFGFKPHFYR